MKLEELVKNIEKIEGKKRLRESKFILARNKKLWLYFEAHKTCARAMVLGNPSYQEVSFMYLNPSYMEEYFTNKFIINIIMYERIREGRK
jgi:hypothetical protein